MPGAEGAPELLAQEPVLDDGALTAADGGDEGGQDEPDEFEHRGRVADHDSHDRRTDSCHLQTLPFTLMWLPVRGAPPRVAGDLLRGCVEAILAQSYGLDPSSPIVRQVLGDLANYGKPTGLREPGSSRCAGTRRWGYLHRSAVPAR